MFGGWLRLGTVRGISHRQGLAIRRISGHVQRGGARRQRASCTSSVHRAADCGREAGSHSSGRGHGLVDRVQHLGRLESLSGHHGAEAQSVRNDRQPRAPMVPRLRGSTRGRAAGAARDCCAARGGAALSPYGVGVREWILQQIRLGRMGELRPAFLSLGRKVGLRQVDLAEPARAAFPIRIFSMATPCVVFVGHDEYWTWEMRDAVDRYVERGGYAARFAGNFMWQTRLERDGKAQVCYKYRARAEDPVYKSADPSRTTDSWEAREIGRPGALTFGLNATNGLYAGWGSMRTARRPRLSGVSTRALGLRRDGALLRRPARGRRVTLSAARSTVWTISFAAVCPNPPIRKRVAPPSLQIRALRSLLSEGGVDECPALDDRFLSPTTTAKFVAQIRFGDARATPPSIKSSGARA